MNHLLKYASPCYLSKRCYMITRYKAVQPQEFTVVMKLVSGEFFHIHCYGLGLQLQSGIRIAIALHSSFMH